MFDNTMLTSSSTGWNTLADDSFVRWMTHDLEMTLQELSAYLQPKQKQMYLSKIRRWRPRLRTMRISDALSEASVLRMSMFNSAMLNILTWCRSSFPHTRGWSHFDVIGTRQEKIRLLQPEAILLLEGYNSLYLMKFRSGIQDAECKAGNDANQGYNLAPYPLECWLHWGEPQCCKDEECVWSPVATCDAHSEYVA